MINAKGVDIDLAGHDLRFDVQGEGMLSFARMHQQSSEGNLTVHGKGNFEVKYVADSERMFWVSTEQGSMNVLAVKICLEFHPYDTIILPSVMIVSSGKVNLQAKGDLVLTVIPESDLEVASFTIVHLYESDSLISGRRIYLSYQGDQANSLTRRGVCVETNEGVFHIGDENTEYLGIANVDQAITLGASGREGEVLVGHVQSRDIELLGTGKNDSVAIRAIGTSDLYVGSKEGRLTIRQFEHAVLAENNAYVWIGTEDAKLSNIDVEGDLRAKSDGLLFARTDTGRLVGDMVASNWGTIDFVVDRNLIWRGSANVRQEYEGDQSSIKLSLGENSYWTLTDTSRVSELSLDRATIDLTELQTESSDNYRLTISEAFSSSESRLVLHSDLLSGQATKVYLNADNTDSTISVGFKDAAEAIEGGFDPVHFATTTSSSGLDFLPEAVLSESGLTILTPTVTSSTEGDETYWYVSQVSETPGYTPQAVMSVFDNAYLVWRSFREGTLERFGDLRAGANHGVWGRVTAGNLSASGLDHDFVAYRIGADAAFSTNWSVGMMIERLEGDVDAADGSGDSDSTSGALYLLGKFDCGLYLDAGFRVGRTDYRYNNQRELADQFRYRAYAVGGWLEAGFDLLNVDAFFMRPHASIQYGRMTSESLQTANGLRASIDAVESLIFSFGADAGWRSKTAELSLTLEAETETLGDMDVSIRSDRGQLHESWSHDDTWVRARINGVITPTEHLQLWVNGSSTFASEIDEDWRLNAGIRWNF